MNRKLTPEQLARPRSPQPMRQPDVEPGRRMPTVSVEAVRCPCCGSANHKVTGTRGLGEDGKLQYRRCADCGEPFILRIF